MSCGVGCRCGSDLELLWLWRRPAAIAPFRPLAWEPSYASGAALEKAERQKNNNNNNKKKPQVNCSIQHKVNIFKRAKCYEMRLESKAGKSALLKWVMPPSLLITQEDSPGSSSSCCSLSSPWRTGKSLFEALSYLISCGNPAISTAAAILAP